MKILMVNKFLYPRGGAETYVFDLAEHLSQNGHEIAYFGMNDSRNSYGNQMGLGAKNSEFREFNMRQIFYPFRIIYSFDARRKMAQVLEYFKPDYVHLNNINFQLTPSIVYAIKEKNIPMIQTLHDFQLICPNHMLYREQDLTVCEKCRARKYSECIRYQCIHNSRIKSVMGAFEAWLYYRLKTYDLIDAFIAPSQFLADKMVDFGENPTKIHTLHNFIKKDFVDRDFNKKNYFLYFGRLSIQKGMGTLLEAVKQLPDVSFVIAGGGELAETIAKADLPNLEYVGFQTGEALLNLIGEARATVIPSEWYENCPMSVLESLTVGTPVIGANIGGIPELIRDGRDGLLFEPASVTSLVEAIWSLHDNDDLAEDMSKNAREILQTHDIQDYAEKLMEIVTTLTMKKRGFQ